jgi:hypothetical protein
MNFSDLVTSWLRTVVPGVWSTVIGLALAWLGAHAPWALDVLEALQIDPTSQAFVGGVVLVVLAAWHYVWRKVEPHVPDWLSRVALGSARTPTYRRDVDLAA